MSLDTSLTCLALPKILHARHYRYRNSQAKRYKNMTKTKVRGLLKTWKEDRGFGFIKPDDGGRDIFLHISSLKGAVRRPIVGDVVYYSITKDHQGKFKAINAQIDGVNTGEMKATDINKPTTGNNKIVLIAVALLITITLTALFIFSK